MKSIKSNTEINCYGTMSSYFTKSPEGTVYLAFRDLQSLCRFNGNKNQALDFGCGAGRSSALLKSYGYNVIGVDICKDLIETAKNTFSEIDFILFEKTLNITQQLNKKFDLILLSFVLMDFSSIKLMSECLFELSNLLNPGGRIIAIVPSEKLYTGRWFSTYNHFSENQNLNSGDIAKLSSKFRPEVILHDYFWTDKDYHTAFNLAKLSIINKHNPLGHGMDPHDWLDEYQHSPYNIYTSIKRS